MTSTDDSPGIVRRGGAAFRRTVTDVGAPAWIAVLGVTVAAACFVGFGGLLPASASPDELVIDEEARTSLYSVTVLDAVTTDAVEEQYVEAEPGETLVVVTLRLENLSDRPIGLGTSADRVESRLVHAAEPLIALADVEPTSSAEAWRPDGSAGGVVLQPGVPDVVQIAWPVPQDAFADGILRIDVHEAEVTRGQVIVSADQLTWRRGDLAARISAPVTVEQAP
ncbi:hypothetical protein [Microbacterium sp. NPDC056234]|uniref:hypothetical protein n=1 Tax=Microbacterium sp. NPDC056234 TaxID=3345757 RepID=UPI0035DB2CDA